MIKIGYFLFISLFCTGLFGLFFWKNGVKRVISLSVFSSSVVVFLITLAYRTDHGIPILQNNVHYVDAIPSALMLTFIIVSASIQALMFATLISSKRQISQK